MRRNKNKLGSILFGIFFWFFYRLNWVSILEILILFRNDRVLTSRRRLKTLISNSTSMRLQKKTCFSRRGTDSIPIAVSSTAESPPPQKKRMIEALFSLFSGWYQGNQLLVEKIRSERTYQSLYQLQYSCTQLNIDRSLDRIYWNEKSTSFFNSFLLHINTETHRLSRINWINNT